MSYQNNPPWTKIHEFLLAAGSQPTIQSFKNTIMRTIHDLIPYECIVWLKMGRTNPVYCSDVVGCSEYWITAHNNYYYRITPPVWKPNTLDYGFVDWARFRHTEYASDFIFPQKISYGTGFVLYDTRGNPSLTLSLTDSGYDYQQHPQIRYILETIQPHLANYYSYLNLIAGQGQDQFHLAELAVDCKLLSKREAEIAGMLCRRLSVPEIGSLLLISPKTVYRHVANIYEKLGVNSRKDLIIKLLTGSSEPKEMGPGL